MTKKNSARKASAYERNTFAMLHQLIADSEYWGWQQEHGVGAAVTGAAISQAQSKDAMLERIEHLHAMRRELLALRKEVRRLRTTKGFID